MARVTTSLSRLTRKARCGCAVFGGGVEGGAWLATGIVGALWSHFRLFIGNTLWLLWFSSHSLRCLGVPMAMGSIGFAVARIGA